MVTEDNAAGKILLDTRNMCRNEDWAFQDYKQAKISAYEEGKGKFKDYKAGKGKKSKLLEMLRENTVRLGWAIRGRIAWYATLCRCALGESGFWIALCRCSLGAGTP